jgi:hypothetical protein
MSLDPKSTITIQTLAATEEKEAAKNREKEVAKDGMMLRSHKMKPTFLLTIGQQNNKKKQKKLPNWRQTRK